MSSFCPFCHMTNTNQGIFQFYFSFDGLVNLILIFDIVIIVRVPQMLIICHKFINSVEIVFRVLIWSWLNSLTKEDLCNLIGTWAKLIHFNKYYKTNKSFIIYNCRRVTSLKMQKEFQYQQHTESNENIEENKLAIYEGPLEKKNSNSAIRFIASKVKLLFTRIPQITMLYELFSLFLLKNLKKLNENAQNVNASQAIQAKVSGIYINDFQRLNLLIGISGVILYGLYRKIFSLTPEQKAQKFFQLKLKQANQRQINWVYNAKKKYYEKFSKETAYYEQKLKELEENHQIFKKELLSRQGPK